MPGRDTDTALRIVHDLTQSVWFGGALMGAYALDEATSIAPDHASRIRGLDRAWTRWQKVSTPAIAMHLAAGVGLTLANRGRLSTQAGASRTVAIRTALTGVTLLTEMTTRRLGRRLGEHPPRIRTSTDPVDVIDETARDLQRKLAMAQWANVTATAAMVAVGSRMGEQQRPRELTRGIASRLRLAA